MRKSKRILSLALTAIMILTIFAVGFPNLKIDTGAVELPRDANGNIIIDGVTQERVVGTDGSYKSTYDNYAAAFLNGASSPTNIVIPGLNAAQDYVIQGMTYYPDRDWMLITAYHNAADGETVQSSKVFAIDAATGDFVAMFSFKNPDGSINTEHGGGIAVSENNIYYACGDDDRQIAYAPISAFANAEVGTHTVVDLVDMVEFNEIGSVADDSKTAYTAYVCYDQGILWTGNFYDMGVKILGISVAATDYSVPAHDQYNSMVFGYELSGNGPAEEWNNLMGATGKDCRGNPSYVIGLNNAIKDVQYAVVDNGKLYLSCSFGTGEGTNSVSLGGMNPYSSLIIADIDLSQPGTKSLTLNTHNGTLDVMAYDIQDYDHFDMMPMSEGLCVVNNKIFITFESASNKYLNEAGTFTGNCNHPIDVVWELDPYELMEISVAEPEKSIYYEKVHNLGEIVDGEEYIIVHEGNAKNPVTLKNYLYAFNADGNFSGHKLSKSETDVIKGYDGMIGHPISYYTLEHDEETGEDILFLEEPEIDDIENVRWTISKNDNGSYKIKSTETYFANNDSFYFDGSKITMIPSNSSFLNNIRIDQLETDSGYFYFSNEGNYLWCNDGVNTTYNTKANAYYTANASNPIFDGVTETPGTFHCDALNATGSNILGGPIDTSDDDPDIQYEDGAFQIYHRKVDEVSSTYESRVYTDLKATLQEDGTYDVILETYAISPNHYQYVGEKPTDYIIVADTSSSMASTGSTGIASFTGSLAVNAMATETATSLDNGKGVNGYAFTNENIYFLHSDGKYYRGYLAVNTANVNITTIPIIGTKVYTDVQQEYYLYYIADDGLYYYFKDSTVQPGMTSDAFKALVDSTANSTAWSSSNSNSTRQDVTLYTGPHYRFDDVNSSFNDEHVRLDTLKTAVTDLVDDIAAQNKNNRIALIQYGADASTGYIANDGSLTQTANANAFWASGTVDQLKTKISALTTSEQTNNTGIEMLYAKNLISAFASDYKGETSTRNVAVILISDGIPGNDNGASATTAANNAIDYALDAKNNGAFVYTVLIGNNSSSDSSFSKKTYMDAVSSKYAAAESLNKIGGMSVDGVNYALSLATTTMNNFVNFGAITAEEVAHNTAVGLDNLGKESYLRQQLNDAFKFPADFNEEDDLIVELISGEFDEVGRFSFNEADKSANDDDAAAIKSTEGTKVDLATKTLTVTGYDYSDEYVARNRTDKDGRKLRVTLKGLLADETRKIRNTSINNLDTTGIYKTQTNMNNNVEFKMLPTSYFNIPEYTYVLDYGLPMYDKEVNGTLKSVSSDLSAQRNANGDLAYKTESENGLVQITNNNLDLIYETAPTNSTDSGYCLIQREDGTYDWFEIKVVPASNVLYEEDWFIDGAATEGAPVWNAEVGDNKKDYQELTDSSSDIYGYDEAYETDSFDHSNDTVLKTTVSSSSSAKRSVTKTVDFIGDGFDLISACGKNTGVIAVSVKNEAGKVVKGYLVDTYYEGELTNGGELAYQVPVVSFKTSQIEASHDTYTIEATALYLSNAGALASKSVKSSALADGKLSATTGTVTDEAAAKALLAEVGLGELAGADLELVWFDDNSVLNGGTGAKGNVKTARDGSTVTSLDCYLDGFRIYHPMNDDNSAYISTERGATYYNVINHLRQAGTTESEIGEIAYVTGDFQADEEGNKPTLSFNNYQNIGPQNEFYLKPGASAEQALVFKVALNVPGSRVHLGLRTVTGKASAKIGGTTFDVKSTTEMYYDVTDCVDTTTESGIAIITIQNDGTGILAVNNVKVTGDATITVIEESELSYAAEMMAAPATRAEVVNGVVTPVVEDDTNVDNGGDNTTGDDNTGSDTTEPENGGSTGSGSFIEQLIAMIMEILRSLFNFLPVGEVM